MELKNWTFFLIALCIGQSRSQDNLLLKGSKKLEKWINPGLSHFTSFSLFNVVNPCTAIKKKNKPNLKDALAYKFQQNRTISVIGWSEDEKYVTVKESTNYTYVGDEDLNRKINTINVPLVIFQNILMNESEKISSYTRQYGKDYLKGYSLFTTQTVGNLLYNGYSDHLVKSMAKFFAELGIKIEKSNFFTEDGRFFLLGNKFKNNTRILKVNTGKFNLNYLGQISEIDGEHLNKCHLRPCDEIKGTDGFVFSSLVGEASEINVFEPEMQRAVDLMFVPSQNESVKKFVWSPLTFNSTHNECYYPNKTDDLQARAGIMHLSELCNPYAPLVLSNPHFWGSDQYFFDQFTGLRNNLTEFDSYVEVDKTTGDLMSKRKSLQVNLDTKSVSHLPRLIFPIYWLREESF